jgi:phosphotriesterase-related protein
MTGGIVRTVLGDVDPRALGHTQPHEHVLSDLSTTLHSWGVQALTSGRRASTEVETVAPTGEFPASVRERIGEPVGLENYDWIKRNVFNWDNLRLISEVDAIAELHMYRVAGGGTVVDSTSIGMGRDPTGCARVSRATGVHIVAGSGYYVHDFHPPGLTDASEDAICEQILSELHDGIADTGIRAGIIGEIGLSWPVHPDELKVLRAAARAQAQSGAALQIHPGRDPSAPLEAMRIVVDAGAEPRRTIMSHIDRTLSDVGDMLELAQTGCYLEFDLFGQESSYYPLNPDARRPNDGTRVDWLMALFEAGIGDRILISQDICQKVYLRRYGGAGYAHIVENVIPLMRRRGMAEDEIRMLTIANPAAALVLT